jgi:hypothetical protein
MNIRPLIACSVVITALALAQGVSAQTPATTPAAASNAPPPVVAEQADDYSRKWVPISALPSSSPSTPTSPSIKCCRRARSCNSPRPRKSYSSGPAGSTSSGTATSAPGSSGTTTNRSPHTTPATPFYASEVAPPEIDSMLDQLVPKLNFAPPLADFLNFDS